MGSKYLQINNDIVISNTEMKVTIANGLVTCKMEHNKTRSGTNKKPLKRYNCKENVPHRDNTDTTLSSITSPVYVDRT